MANIKDLHFDDKNFNKHTEYGMSLLEKSLRENGAGRSILIDKDNNIIAGNGIIEAAGQVGIEKVKIVEASGDEIVAVKRSDIALDSEEGRTMALADNATASVDLDWDKGNISEFFTPEDTKKWGVKIDWDNNSSPKPINGSLLERFGVPPYSILDTRQGYWKDRKKQWLSLGIKSEIGREERLSNLQDLMIEKYRNANTSLNGTSVFDPVLTEIMYRWFAKEGGTVLDPFAGGSVRGIIASKLGLDYTGCELRKEQVAANIENANELCEENMPTWIQGDSNLILDKIDEKFDFIFSCPPYADLEIYSDDPADLSNMSHEKFIEVYRSIIKKSIEHLDDNSFATFVVSEVRNKKGVFIDLIPTTIKAFEDAGAAYYNEIILLNNSVTAGLRANRTFGTNRKILRTHQNVLVFYKGDVSKIKENFSILDEVEFNDAEKSEL